MGRLKQTVKRKRISSSCIFCGDEYKKYRAVESKFDRINYIHIPPLNNEFHIVCDNCMPTLEKYKNMFPYLWE